MRSRNGNRPLLRALCALIALTPLLWGDAYIISYRGATRDAVLINENLAVAPAMRPCTGRPGKPLVLPAEDDNQTLRQILERNREPFFTYLQSLPLHIVSYDDATPLQTRSTTVLRLPPRCFTVDFNDGFVTIAPLW